MKRAYLVATAVAVLVFIGSGMANVLRLEHVAHDMRSLGYPPYFMTVLGFWKVLGGLVLLLPSPPRLKEWAYAGMTFDLTGAAASRAATHDAPATIIAPLVILAFVLCSWRCRPCAASG